MAVGAFLLASLATAFAIGVLSCLSILLYIWRCKGPKGSYFNSMLTMQTVAKLMLSALAGPIAFPSLAFDSSINKLLGSDLFCKCSWFVFVYLGLFNIFMGSAMAWYRVNLVLRPIKFFDDVLQKSLYLRSMGKTVILSFIGLLLYALGDGSSYPIYNLCMGTDGSPITDQGKTLVQMLAVAMSILSVLFQLGCYIVLIWHLCVTQKRMDKTLTSNISGNTRGRFRKNAVTLTGQIIGFAVEFMFLILYLATAANPSFGIQGKTIAFVLRISLGFSLNNIGMIMGSPGISTYLRETLLPF